MHYKKPNILLYRIAQAVSWLVATFVFRRKVLRNEIRGKKGPFVVIANHQAALDFVNLIGLRRRPMSFVISNSFYNTLPVKGYMNQIGVIPKQQFQTSITDMRRMRAVIRAGEALVIYPAGLMCEDGLSTPIPAATYKFLRWLGVDVYVARTMGTYFTMPKWSSGMRPGRTYMDVYRLFTAEELAAADPDTIRAKTDEALLFDAYREQEKLRVPYKKGGCVAGLEHVLYRCPHCGEEFSIALQGTDTLRCTACGFAQRSDELGFFHRCGGEGDEVRYVSDWSRMILDAQREKILSGKEDGLSSPVEIHMINEQKKKFRQVGQGTLTLNPDSFLIEGELHGETVSLSIPTAGLPTLPFSPGKYLEVQHGADIYRCYPTEGKLVMKFINILKIFYEQSAESAKTSKNEIKA